MLVKETLPFIKTLLVYVETPWKFALLVNVVTLHNATFPLRTTLLVKAAYPEKLTLLSNNDCPFTIKPLVDNPFENVALFSTTRLERVAIFVIVILHVVIPLSNIALL